MAKLYFRYGVVSSAKTLNLLAVAHNYRSQGKKVLVLKPQLDDRFGLRLVRSRAGLEMEADLLVTADHQFEDAIFDEISCILVDEAQFISPVVVERLRSISLFREIPVICYGLRSDFRGNLFAGSRRLFELADTIEEVKTTCYACNKKAIMNLKHVGGKATLSGPSIDLGADEKYYPACYRCYLEQLELTAPPPRE